MKVKCPHCGTEYDIEHREFGRYVTCQICGKGFVAGARQTRVLKPGAEAVPPSDVPPESACLKSWAWYWLTRLLIVLVVSSILGVLGGFVGGITGCAPVVDWPKEFPERMAHVVVYVAWIGGIILIWRLAWWGYKKFAIRNLVGDSASNMFSSWFLPILVNTALSLLMPMSLQISVLGVYGYVVWCITIWIVVDYLMFRFISVNLLFGKKIDSRWICPAVLFSIFIAVMYGFARIAENEGVRRHDALLIYGRMKEMDDSRHHDASQSYNRMKEMDDSRRYDASKIYDRMGRMKLY